MRPYFLLLATLFVSTAGYADSFVEAYQPERIVGDEAKRRIHALFEAYDPNFADERRVRERRFDELGVDLFERTVAGDDTRCSQQIFVEAKWLVGYTAWWPRIDARLDELGQSFEIEDQSFADRQYYADGFFGRCANAAFIRLESTAERFMVLADEGTRPARRWRPFLRPGRRLADEFRDLLISDIARSGEDYRSRLGGMVSIITRVVRDEHVVELVRETRDGPMLSQAEMQRRIDDINGFVDAWQDPVTGYWGAWYRDGETVFSTADLSITYHIIHARKGRVQHWPQIIETTLAISDDAYPFGWLSDGRWHNHNNYDLARMFRYGWDHMTPAQQRRVGALMQEMIDWAFTETLADSYRGFKLFPEISSSVGAELYFGASFLDAAGFFAPEPWYGTLRRPAHPARVCANLQVHAQTLDPNDTYVIGAVKKFDRACARWVHRG